MASLSSGGKRSAITTQLSNPTSMLNKKTNSHRKSEDPNQEITARKIANKIIGRQVRLANFLNQRTAHFTKGQKQILLVIISVFFSALSLYLIFTSLY